MNNKREYIIIFLLLVVAIALFWWRVWIPNSHDRMHFSDDILVKDYPTRVGLFRMMQEGHSPLWDPNQLGGWPGFANCEAGLLYPLNYVVFPFAHDPQTGFWMTEMLVLLHFLLAGMGVYCFARSLGLNPWGAGMAALVYTFCGFHCAHKKHTNMIFVLAWFPWIFLQLETYFKEKKSSALFLATLLLAISFTAGHPQSSLYMCLILSARILHNAFIQEPSFTSSKLRGALITIVFLVGVAFALTAVQWLPTAELIQQGERAEADYYEQSSEYSMPLFELTEIILPDAYRYWEQVEVFYWGIIPLLLIVYALSTTRLTSWHKFFVGLALVSILFALGQNLFLYDLSYLLLPGTAWVRAPSRWIYFATLPVALFAGQGIHQLTGNPGIYKRKAFMRFRRNLWIVLTTCLVVFGLVMVELFSQGHSQIVQALNNQSGDTALLKEEWSRVMQGVLLFILFAGIFVALIHLTFRKKISAVVAATLLLLFTWSDLATQFRTFELNEGEGGYEINEEAEKLRPADWSYRTKVFFEDGGNRTLYHGAAQGFRELDGQSPLTPELNLHMREDTSLENPEKANHVLFDFLGVETFLTDVGSEIPHLTRETNHLYHTEETSKRARGLYDAFYTRLKAQRGLLSLQSFPWNYVPLIPEPEEREWEIHKEKRFFPKPFLLASASSPAVNAGAYLIVDGKNHFSDFDEPGYYIAIADSNRGKIEETRMFNLMKSYQDSEHPQLEEMVDFIDSIPQGKTVFAAVSDNASNVLFPEGLAALRAIGASIDVRGNYQWAHAIVGEKGDSIGSALEIVSPTEALVLQTKCSVYTHGIIADRPEFYTEYATQYAEEWVELYERLDRDDLPAKFNVPSSTKTAVFQKPLQVTSVPKTSDLEDQAVIRIGEEDVSLNEMGYNLAVIEPESFEVVQTENFNLLSDYVITATQEYVKSPPEANLQMQEFIRSVTEGHILVGAIRDEAIDLMQPKTLEFLKDLGSEPPFDLSQPDQRKRMAHAFVCIKGTTECIESYRQAKPASVFLFSRYRGGPALMHTDRDDDRTEVIIPSDPVTEMIEHASRTLSYSQPVAGETWAVEDLSSTHFRITGNAKNAGYLFTSELFYPGWKIYVDGIETPIQRINYYFRGVPIEEGIHTIEMIYAPLSFLLGLWISLVSVVLFIAYWVWSCRRME